MEKKSNDYDILHKKILYDKNISSSAKILFGEIESLCFKVGFCWATNKYFANLYQVSTRTVERWIENLVVSGYITRNICFYPNSKQVKKRILKINVTMSVPPYNSKRFFPTLNHIKQGLPKISAMSVPPDNFSRSVLTKICGYPLTKRSYRIYKYNNKKRVIKNDKYNDKYNNPQTKIDISKKNIKKNTPEPAKTLGQRDLIEEFHKKGV